MTTVVERSRLGSAAVFVPVDTFVRSRRPGAAATAVCPLRFLVTAMGGRALDPGWTLSVRHGSSGAYLADGALVAPDRRTVRPRGGPLDVTVDVEGPAYRRGAAPLAVRLVNLDPAATDVAAPPIVHVDLVPGFDYPFPLPQGRYALVRGSVQSAARGPGVDAAVVTTATVPPSAWTDTYVTGPDGQFVVVLPEPRAGPIRVTAQTPRGSAASATATVLAGAELAIPPFLLP